MDIIFVITNNKTVQEEIGVKKVFSILICLYVICVGVNLCHSATTSDGLITLDFFEDTTHGVPDLWQLDFTVNDIGGGIESLTFDLTFFNANMAFNSQLNPSTVFYGFSGLVQNPGAVVPVVRSKADSLPVPVSTLFSFFLNSPISEIPNPPDLIPVIGEIPIFLDHKDNLGNEFSETLTVTGPIGFVVVPEPISISLYVFGFILLPFLSKKFISKK